MRIQPKLSLVHKLVQIVLRLRNSKNIQDLYWGNGYILKPYILSLHRRCQRLLYYYYCHIFFLFSPNLVAPRFLVPPGDVYALKGETAVLECKPESSPPATITWLRYGANLPGTGNQYIIDDVRSEDEGDYTCKARNSRGSTQEVVKLSIGSKCSI